MGGRIPINLDVDYSQRNPEPNSVPSSFGMNRFRAVEERAGAIARLGGQVADVATQYAAKNKAADLQADGLAAQSKLRAIEMDAEQRASSTTDPEQVRQIWSDAHTQYGQWINGKSDKEGSVGIPNVRWNDQRGQLIAAHDAIKPVFDQKSLLRIAEIGKHESNSKALGGIHEAVGLAGTDPSRLPEAYDLIGQNADVLYLNGTWTKEKRDEEVRVSRAKADKLTVDTNIAKISNMNDPVEAQKAADKLADGLQHQEEGGTFSMFEHLGEDDRAKSIHTAKAAASTVAAAKKQALDNLYTAEDTRFNTDSNNGAKILGIPIAECDPDILANHYQFKPSTLFAMKKEYAKKPVEVTPQTVMDTISEINATPDDAGSEAALRFKIQKMNLDQSAKTPIDRALSAKFSAEGKALPHQKAQAAQEELVGRMIFARNDGAGKKEKLPVKYAGEADPKDGKWTNASDLGQAIAAEQDIYKATISTEMQKGKSFPDANDAYWNSESGRTLKANYTVKQIQASQNERFRSIKPAAPSGSPAGYIPPKKRYELDQKTADIVNRYTYQAYQ